MCEECTEDYLKDVCHHTRVIGGECADCNLALDEYLYEDD